MVHRVLVPETSKHYSKLWKESRKEEEIFNFTNKNIKFCQDAVFWQNFFIKHSIMRKLLIGILFFGTLGVKAQYGSLKCNSGQT
jgi:hypothetical protein